MFIIIEIGRASGEIQKKTIKFGTLRCAFAAHTAVISRLLGNKLATN